MGIFDRFKKKEDTSQNLFPAIRKYKEYIIHFIHFQQQGNHAPIAAYEGMNEEITGFLFVNGEETYTLSVGEVVTRMEHDLGKRLARGEIKSYVTLYHSQFANDNNHAIATQNEDLKAITITYNLAGGQSGKIALPYTVSDDGISYSGIQALSPEENNEIFQTSLQAGKDYFAERIAIRSEPVENAAGLMIKKSNTGTLGNTWGGIFGFEYFNNGGGDVLQEYFALTLAGKPAYAKAGVIVSELSFGPVTFRAVAINGKAVTLMPVVKTTYAIDVENITLNEWENSDNTEAIVNGQGRGQFAITYFATDYAQNRGIYTTTRKTRLKPSGIAYVLDTYKGAAMADSEIKFSEDFTSYMPNKEWQSWGCFDFIGELEDFRVIHILNDKSLKAYILTVRLITHPDIRNFFTIDIYVNPGNMRFTELIKGMKLTGMFQLQGELETEHRG